MMRTNISILGQNIHELISAFVRVYRKVPKDQPFGWKNSHGLAFFVGVRFVGHHRRSPSNSKARLPGKTIYLILFWFLYSRLIREILMLLCTAWAKGIAWCILDLVLSIFIRSFSRPTPAIRVFGA